MMWRSAVLRQPHALLAKTGDSDATLRSLQWMILNDKASAQINGLS